MYKGFDLTGRVAALTGSSSGMGFAIARALCECGAKVVLSGHLEPELDDAVATLSRESYDVAGVVCDITRPEHVAVFGERSMSAFGKVDILFALAAPQAPVGPLQAMTPDAFEKLLSGTVVSNFALARQFLPDMVERRDGSIVFMSSIAAERANPVLGGYGAAKAALNSLVRNIAVEVGAFNVRANAISPSIVRTAFSKDIWSDDEREKALLAKIPAGRIATVDDIVGAAILLASPGGSYISGQTLLIDGGRSVW
ncbi:NAD(P)-dependent dehydrogenase (short-subunit alcohol dehydrogenase family) [Rhizobium sp. PP-CC-3G-465]|nr:NAD(P)-dependent dehydrogenase (short-subunit alcohol dehydrogenase family) [Rhizobium sp. PP-CC-3G-465]